MQPDPRWARPEFTDDVLRPSVPGRTRMPSSLTSTRRRGGAPGGPARLGTARPRCGRSRPAPREPCRHVVGRLDRPRHDLGSADKPADLLDHGLVDRAGWHPADRPVILAALNGEHGDVVVIAAPFLPGVLGRHRPAIGSEDQPTQQRHVARRGSTGPLPGWLTEYGLSFGPEVFCNDGLMLAGVGFLLMDGEADVGPVLQDLVQNDLVERPPRALADAVGVEFPQHLGDRPEHHEPLKDPRTIAEPAGR